MIWPAYFSDPAHAPPMPPMQLSLPCYSGTWESIHEEFATTQVLEGCGHFPWLERPGCVRSALDTVVGTSRSSGGNQGS
jgi:hypothetical protein